MDIGDPLDWGRNNMRSGYEIAQICLNGHVINPAVRSFPEHSSEFCAHCGSKTITKCPRCETPIRGEYFAEDVVIMSSYRPPVFCHACGHSLPWTQRAIKAARELVAELGDLSEDERELLTKSINDLVTDTPRTELAATRVKRYLAKLGDEARGIVVEVITKIATEAAKKSLGL